MKRDLPSFYPELPTAQDVVAPYVGNWRLLTSSVSARAASAADLAAPPPRPGSQDALQYPSRMGDNLHYRDGRITDMAGNPVGATKTRRDTEGQTIRDWRRA